MGSQEKLFEDMWLRPLNERSSGAESTISAIERGWINFGVERAKVLARALKCHPSVLVFPGWDASVESAAEQVELPNGKRFESRRSEFSCTAVPHPHKSKSGMA